MKVAVFGYGNAGRRHVEIIERLHPDVEVVIVPNKLNAHAGALGSLHADVAFITNPTHAHVRTALRCARLGMHLFIEKPLCCFAGPPLKTLLDVCNTNKLSTYVAYPLRHHFFVETLREELPCNTSSRIVCRTNMENWPKRMHMDDYYRRARGAGALLELSHEIDYAEYVFGPIVEMSGHKLYKYDNTPLDCESGAIIEIKHIRDNKTIVELDILSNREERFIEVFNKRIDIKPYPSMYDGQLDYFFNVFPSQNMSNNVYDASRTLDKILTFRDLERWPQ